MMNELRDIPISDLIPQRPPFVMVDRLLHFDVVRTTTELEVRSDNLFFEDGRLTASGLIENIAQTCAVRMGYIHLSAGLAVKLGYIGAIRNLQILRTPALGERLTTSIEVREEIFQMTLVEASIKSGNDLLVSAEMKIALSDIDSQS